MDKERIGFISTRFAGTDGVSLEAAKWAEVLEQDGHEICWYAGRLDRDEEVSLCVPEAHFEHPEVQWINDHIWGRVKRSGLVSRRIQAMSQYLKYTIQQFVQQYDLSLLIIENALTIPMNLPLGVAISEFLQESYTPAVAHHHDFYWERSRFMVNAVNDYLDMAFPPRESELQHVVINKNARDDLARRKGVSSHLIPNVLNFSRPPGEYEVNKEAVREQIGLSEDDILFLQPTRVVPRKGIEHAINLVSMLDDERCKLVISHESGDEGFEYEYMLRQLADRQDVDMRFVDTHIGAKNRIGVNGEEELTLWDLYPCADFVTYPSLYEGFGNAFLEAVYFKVPMLVNRYDIFLRDIEPKGFDVITMDGYVTPDIADRVRYLLNNPTVRREMAEHNYQLAECYYGYPVLRNKLRFILSNTKGE